MTFEDLELDPILLRAIEEQHFNKPTPIQEAAIPEILLCHDVLAGAATGTGKTAAFVLPALQFLLDNPKRTKHPRILMMAPTRELAFQIHKVVKQLGTYCQYESAVVTGGFASDKQLEQLQGPIDILVATPGRLLNLMTEEFIDLANVELVVIDEADRMLDMGQGPDVMMLLEAIPEDFQGACFSATLSGAGVQKFADEILDDPIVIQVNAHNEQSAQIQQQLYFADDKAHKLALLKNMLQDDSCQSAIVFCNKKERATELAEWVLAQGISSTVLHGDFIQAKRLEKTNKFKQGKIKVLIATDVAARGLDILNVTHVINYDVPFRGDTYIHRIGRTGRAQQVGIAITLVEPHDYKHLKRIEYHIESKIPIAKIAGLEPKITLSKLAKRKKPHKKKLAKKIAKNAPKKKVKKKKLVRPNNDGRHD